MSKKSPEWHQTFDIVESLIQKNWFGRTSEGEFYLETDAIKALAAPLEAANARVRELEEAVRVLAKHAYVTTWQLTHKGENVMDNLSMAVSANPTARAAIEAAAGGKA